MPTLRTLLAGVAVLRADGPLDIPIAGIAYDSRRVAPGWLFVAITGYHTDGHAYIDQAVARGAVAVVVDARRWGQAPAPASATLVAVPDSRVALAPLAAAFYGYPALDLFTIGVTGTKGKSTTTDLISQVLDRCGYQTGMISTVDFKIGKRRWANTTRQSTPEAPDVQALLAEMVAEGCDTAVIEATSHALSARWNRLEGCLFDMAVFLNLGHEHLDYHGTFEQYRADKARLFELLADRTPDGRRKGDGWAIVNADDPNHEVFLRAAPATARRLRFGIETTADVRAYDVVSGVTGSQATVDTPWGRVRLHLPLPGRFNLANALAALSAAGCRGVPVEQAAAALAEARGPRGRMEAVRMGQPFDVIVDYAHNPESFEQVFSMLRPVVKGRIIVVFGSAGERDVAKRALQGEIAGRYCDTLILTDEDPRGEDPLAIISQIAVGVERAGRRAGQDYQIIPDRAEAIATAIGLAQPGDLVLLLGKGHEGSIIYADHSRPWDEIDEARRALSARGYGARAANDGQ